MSTFFKISNERLRVIQKINITQREIDVLACLISNKSVKKIADLLQLSSKTINTHIDNIKKKMACFSRDEIICFLEKSGVIPDLRKHYMNLLIVISFNKLLVKIGAINRSNIQCNLEFTDDSYLKYDHIKLVTFKNCLSDIFYQVGITLTTKKLLGISSIQIDYSEIENEASQFALISHDGKVLYKTEQSKSHPETNIYILHMYILRVIQNLINNVHINELITGYKHESINILKLAENPSIDNTKIDTRVNMSMSTKKGPENYVKKGPLKTDFFIPYLPPN